MNKFVRLTLIALFSSAFLTTVSAQYQLPNSGFEGEWNAVSKNGKSGYEPTGWHSFLSMKTGGSLYNSAIALKLESSSDVRPGSTGTQSAKIWANAVKVLFFSVVANGNLTTGQIYGGSTSATDASGNYNFSDPSNTGYNQTFTGKPDSIAQWVKFVPVKSGDKARVSAIIHENSRYQDPEATTYTNVVAKAQMNYSATAGNGWQRLSIPFSYESGDKTPAYILVSYSTSETPGGGSENDAVYIDDIEMIYNSKLTSATFGNMVLNPTEGKYNYSVTLDKGNPYPAFVSAETNGVSATYDIEWPSDNTAVITVKGGDISENPENKNVYRYTFFRTFTASVKANDPEMGSVYIMNPGTTSADIMEGNSVSIIATANQHYEFVEWVDNNGNHFSSDASCLITVTGDETYTAVFREITHTVSVSCDETMGHVYVGDNTGSTSAQIGDGKNVTVNAEAENGYMFEGWKNSFGDMVSSNTSYTVENVTEDVTLTAVFVKMTNSDLSFELDGDQSVYIEEGSFSNIASATDSEGEVTYAITWSSADDIATVDANSGTVTLLGTGTIEVTATQAQWGKYLETEASYRLEILSSDPSGVEETSATDNLNAYGMAGGIMVTGIEGKARVRVFSLNSVMVNDTYADGNTLISVPYKGIYLVEVSTGNGRKVFRAAVK